MKKIVIGVDVCGFFWPHLFDWVTVKDHLDYHRFTLHVPQITYFGGNQMESKLMQLFGRDFPLKVPCLGW